MATVEERIDVDVPVRVAYDQWTQFESFPQFMEGVDRISQDDARTLTWVVTVAGRQKEWIARIVDQTPDHRIAWKSVEGTDNAGAVLFDPIGSDRTRITLRIDAEPDGILERMGEAVGVLDHRVKGDLERFKDFIEQRGEPTGAWRGEIHGAVVSDAWDSRHSASGAPRRGGADPSEPPAVGSDLLNGGSGELRGPSTTDLPTDDLLNGGSRPR
jgi:hypothetical protein